MCNVKRNGFWGGLLAAGVMMFIAISAQAEQVDNIFTEKVLVANQSTDIRRKATRTALERVLIRATGLLEPAKDPRVMPILKNAEGYVGSFLYENSDELITYSGQEVQASALVLNFSGPVLEQLLRNYGLPVWPSNRPSTLVWLVEDSRSGRNIPSYESGTPLGDQVTQAGATYGLPLVLPVMDLEDQRNINGNQLWRVDEASIDKASQRYGVDAVLVARYSKTSSGRWLGTWTVLQQGRQTVLDVSGKTRDTMLDRGFSLVMQHMAEQYSIVDDGIGGTAVTMLVHGINNFNDYASVLNYLNGLAVVESASPIKVDGAIVSLNLYLDGELSLLLDALALDNKLIATPADQTVVVDMTAIDATTVTSSTAGVDQSAELDQNSNQVAVASGADATVGLGSPQLMAPRGSEQNPLQFTWP